MCEQTEINYLDGEVVWVKLGSCWWPGQVVGDDKVPPDVIQSFRKAPIAIVKFFEEDTFEYVRNNNHIFKYQCSRKDEFIKKGLDNYRSKHGAMEKFPEDVIRAECHTDGDANILKREEFQEVKKESYAGLFGDSKTPTPKKGRISKTKVTTPKFSPFSNKKRSTEYKVTYLMQQSSSSTYQSDETNNASANNDCTKQCTSPEASSSETPAKSSNTTPQSVPGMYTCHACPFSTSRLNVLIHHNKTHSSTFTPYKTTPINKKIIKSISKTTPKSTKTDTDDKIKKTPKSSKPKKNKINENKETEKTVKAPKRIAEAKPPNPTVKKSKTDEEIKNSLLADWEDEWGEEKEDNSVVSPEVPAEAKSPAVPISADCMAVIETPNKDICKSAESNDLPEPSSDAKYDFCEDEDWPLEADIGRKIPRVKNISKHKTDILTMNNEEEDVASNVAKEVAELLEKTVVPVLPTVSDLLKIEENFPDASIAKSPDKVISQSTDNKIPLKKDTVDTPVKTIFKTKTFFRSRHSRSQDAIEKYVAEQLQNHPEKIDSLDSDINGSEVTCSPEQRVSPLVEPIKVARLAPKIELKRMKAEAQLKERNLLKEITAKSKGVIETPHVLQAESSMKEQLTIQQPLSTGVANINLPVNEIQSNINSLPNLKAINVIQTEFSLNEQPLSQPLLVSVPEEKVVKLNEIYNKNQQLDESKGIESKEIAAKSKSVIETSYVLQTESAEREKSITQQPLNTKVAEINLPINETQTNNYAPANLETMFEPNIIQTEFSLKDQLIDNQPLSISVPEKKPTKVKEIQSDIDQTGKSKNLIESLNDIQTDQPITINVTERNPHKLNQIQSNINESDKLQDIIKPPNIVQTEFSQEDQPVDTQPLSINEPESKLLKQSEDQSDLSQVIIETQIVPLKEQPKDTQPLSTCVPEKKLLKVNESLTDNNQSYKMNASKIVLQPDLCLGELSLVTPTLSTLVHDNKETTEVTQVIQSDTVSDNQNNLIKDDALEKNNRNKKYVQSKEETFNIKSVVNTECDVDKLNNVCIVNSSKTELEHNHMESSVKSNLYSGIESNYDVEVVKYSTPQQSTVFEHPTDNADIAPTESERVTKVTSNDPPDVLFEEDIITTEMDTINTINGSTITHENEPELVVHKDEHVIHENVIMDDTVKEYDNANIPPEQMEVSEIAMEVLVQNEEIKYDEKTNLKEKAANIMESTPSESDLQIAEALINLPTTHKKSMQPSNLEERESISIHNQPLQNEKTEPPSLFFNMQMEQPIFFNEQNVDPIEQEIVSTNEENVTNEIQTPVNTIPAAYSEVVLNQRFETEEEKSENLNAAQSLVQMSEQISETCDPKLPSTITCDNTTKKTVLNIEAPALINRTNVITENKEIKTAIPFNTNTNSETVHKSKLLRILEEPIKKIPNISPKTLLPPSKEKHIGYDSVISSKSNRSNQKVTLIRRNVPSKITTKNVIESPTDNNIVLSKMKTSQDGSNIQTYTIQGTPEKTSDSNTIIIQQKIKKLVNTPPKLQKIKPHSNIIEVNKKIEQKTMNVCKNDEVLFDINSMPVVLSDDIVTAEDIEKMPFVITDGNIITNTTNKPLKTVIKEIEKPPPLVPTFTKSEIPNRSNTPNIISKSTKGKGGNKPMLVIDKTTGKQKIIVAPPETSLREKEEQKPNKSEKFIILPQTNPRSSRPQKIVIDPQTGKAHMLVPKSSEPTTSDSKPVTAKLIPSLAEPGAAPSGTIMIITNAQGTQSKIVLTPEHEKILFPKKQRVDATQLKTITQQQRLTNVIQKQSIPKQNIQQKQPTIITSVPQNIQTKQNKLIPKQQKSAIITSKGQLIVGGKLAATATTSKPTVSEPRTSLSNKRLVISECAKPSKSQGEPLIFLQQKSGAIVQLTAAQFDHLQKTGQIIQKTQTPTPVIQENKVVIQKSVTLKPGNSPIQKVKNRVTKSTKTFESPIPAKKVRQEVNTPMPHSKTPNLIHSKPPSLVPSKPSSLVPSKPQSFVPTSSSVVQSLLLTENAPKTTVSAGYPELDNFEELLPSTAIVKKQEPPKHEVIPPAQPAPPAAATDLAASISDGQLVAVPGESFGGPQGSFYLCIEDNGTLTPIDNRPLILENNQLVPMAVEPTPAPQPERRDILEAALANSDVFQGQPAHHDAPDFRDLNANVSVHCRVSETSTTLNQPIMTPVEVPSKRDSDTTVAATLEAGLAVIGVTGHGVPTSLELPITVTDPRIAPRVSDPLGHPVYCPPLLSPAVDAYNDDAGRAGSISMPLLSEDDGMGKSMPILTDDLSERVASSVESGVASPADGRDADAEDGWSRRLLTPSSDCSETSAEIPLQPSLQISVNELHQNG